MSFVKFKKLNHLSNMPATITNGCIYFVKDVNKIFVDFDSERQAYSISESDVATYTEGTIRKANARGGFGEAVSLSGSDGIHNITNVAAENADAPRFNTAGQRVGKSFKGLVICNGKKYIK